MEPSRYETSILRQPELVSAALSAPRPAWMKAPKQRRCFLVGIGTNHHAACLAAWLWRGTKLDAEAWHSFDFVARPPRLKRGDLGIFLSHRGGKSYTLQAEALARRAGVETVILTGAASPWKSSPRRIETGPMEDTGAFTQSLTTALAWLLRWPDVPELLAPFQNIKKSLKWGPAFPNITAETDVVVLGDGLREWLAREAALKLLETSYLRVRTFGLEEFLHGPNVSVGHGSVVVGFSSARQVRWKALRNYLRTIETPFVDVSSEDWLAQLLWGQRLALETCRRLNIDPDLLRTDDPRYRRARFSMMSPAAG